MRAFPVIYARDVPQSAAFWEQLGFTRRYSYPDNDPGYISLRRDGFDVAVTTAEWAARYGLTFGTDPRFEMFVYVDELDRIVEELRAGGAEVLREPADMPWGERVAYVTDPDGNPVALAQAA